MGGGTTEAGLLCLREGDPDINDLLGGRFDTVTDLLNKYIEEIERFNPLYKLVGAKDREELVVKHILDSLAGLGVIRRLLDETSGGVDGQADGGVDGPAASPAPPLVADVGSGAGLPGIPLAITLPNCGFTLIERGGRRAGFLRNTLAVLGLPNAEAEAVDMEKAGEGRFDLVTFRAFRPLEPALLKSLFRLLRPGGALAAYKGRRDTLETELEGLGGPERPGA
ncbi:MAG: class I SAM-dependent methyltransferase, partial [Spirochaetaceae bacterium]|nr:class I SAM-dependent methyltransferase [Spirochaetaceae bacterium]